MKNNAQTDLLESTAVSSAMAGILPIVDDSTPSKMKAEVRLMDVEQAVPELITAFRGIKDLPLSVVMEVMPTVEAHQEKELRDKFPKFWEGLTMIEWRLFVQLFHHRDSSRAELKMIMHAGIVDMDEWGEHYSSNVVDVHIKNLRKKMRFLGGVYHIISKIGWGYGLREGNEPERSVSPMQQQFHMDKRITPKKLNPDGSLKLHPWRRNRSIFNAVEFGYLKEMIMDDMTKEQCAAKLSCTPEMIEKAWELKSYDTYHDSALQDTKRLRKVTRLPRCANCGEEGHNKKTCPQYDT